MISAEQSAVFRRLDSGGVILNVKNGDYFEVNAAGRFIWEIIADGVERKDLIDQLATTFDMSNDTAEQDVDTFLGELGERSLIRVET